MKIRTMKKSQISLAFMFFTVMLMSSCGKSGEVLDALSQMLSTNNVEGTWIVTEATSKTWKENVGIISESADNETLGAMLRFTTTDVVINTSSGQTFNAPYTINVLANTLTLEVEPNKFDAFNVITFALPTMIIENLNPQSSDYEFDSGLNANIYKQKKITLVKQ